jgi:tRNA G37 N-methylase Trm5
MITTYKCNYSDIKCNNKIIKVDINFIKKIFFNIDKVDTEKILFTDESIYSSSRLKGSKRLIDVINKYYDNFDITITDGTANIGTDSINLATLYKKINAVELSPINYKALKNNISVFGLEKKILSYNQDINIQINDLEQNIIYIDAPWGGPEYKHSDKIKLYLGNVEIVDFYLKNRNKAETFIFKVPYNYNFSNLYNKIKDKINKHSYKKGSVIKYYLLVIKK